MRTRIVLGTIMIAAIAAVLWWDHHLQEAQWPVVGAPLFALAVILVVAGYLEFARLAGAAGVLVLRCTGAACAIALAGLPMWLQVDCGAGLPAQRVPLVAFAAIVVAVFLAQMASHRTDQAIRRIAGTLMGIAYLGILTACLVALRVEFGIPALVMFLAAVKFTDIGAYFTGTLIGRHKLIPWLSPGKSWEGLLGGLAAGAGAAIGANWLLGSAGGGLIMTVSAAAVFGLSMGLAGQFGDLCESLLKRDANLKDSGAVIPEFGGVLDIVDSPLVAAPIGYVLLAVLT